MRVNRLISVIAKRSMIVACLLFTLCVKVPDAPHKVLAEVVYRFNGELDMLKLFNFTVTYTDAKNKVVTEKIVKLPWNKSIKTSIPFDAHFEVNFGAKTLPSTINYATVGFGGDIVYNTSDGQTNIQSKQQEQPPELKPRLNYTDDNPLVLNAITINGGNNAAYSRNVKIGLDATGTPLYYRAAETADLSGVAWRAIVGEDIDYELTEEYGFKTIYVQVKSEQTVTETVSAQIKYAPIPETGTINRAAIEAYVTKYTGHKLIFDQKLNRK